MHSAYYSNSRNPILQSSFEQIHFPSILVSETFAEIQAVQDSTSRNSILLLQVHQFQWQFHPIHSTLLRAPIGIEFNFYFKNFQ